MENFVLVEEQESAVKNNTEKSDKYSWLRPSIMALGIFAIGYVGYIVGDFDRSGDQLAQSSEVFGINSDGYQAVTLTNGQVYFGKIRFEGNWAILSEVYYPAQSRQLQEGEGGIHLIKSGSEAYGPEDEVNLPIERIVTWQNIREDSELIKAIEKFKKDTR